MKKSEGVGLKIKFKIVSKSRFLTDMNGVDGVVDQWGKYLDRYGWEVDHEVLGCCDCWSDHSILEYCERSIYSPSHPLHICPDYSDCSCDS